MSDRNSNHTVVPENGVSLPSVVRTLSGTLNAEVEEESAIARKKKGNGTPTMTSMNTAVTPLFKG